MSMTWLLFSFRVRMVIPHELMVSYSREVHRRRHPFQAVACVRISIYGRVDGRSCIGLHELYKSCATLWAKRDDHGARTFHARRHMAKKEAPDC